MNRLHDMLEEVAEQAKTYDVVDLVINKHRRRRRLSGLAPVAVAAIVAVGLVVVALPWRSGAPPRRATPATSTHPQPTAGPVNLVPDGYLGRFRLTTTVLENEHHGPQLCGMVATSMPPKCGGLDISGWTWEGLKHESALSTKWGMYLVTGTFDGRTFKLTEPARVEPTIDPRPRTLDFTSPCPAPAGGWKPVDPARATDDALQAANRIAETDPDFAGLWIDQKRSPNDKAAQANDPTKLVLNVRFTKDLARHEADIRAVWGGALCVTQAKHSLAELAEFQRIFATEPGLIYVSSDIITNTVELGVFVATQARQRELDAKYGPGLVNLAGILQPID